MHSESRRGRVFARWFAAVAVVSPVLLAVVAGGVPAQAAQHAAGGRLATHARYQLPAGVTNPCAAATPRHATCAALVGTPRHGARVKPATSTTPAGYAPSDLQSAYRLPNAPPQGGGETVAVVTAYDDPNAESDPALSADRNVNRAGHRRPIATECPGNFYPSVQARQIQIP